MRHRNKTVKLGRTSEHREAMLANLVRDLVLKRRVTTTLEKAKAARPLAERMVTLGKRGDLAARRLAISRLHLRGPGAGVSGDKKLRAGWNKNEDAARVLFDEVAPAMKDRNGGYTRIYKLGPRKGDGAERAILEWVTYVPPQPVKKESKPAKGGKKAAPEGGDEAQGDKKE